MKVETRQFKHKRFVLLIPQNSAEQVLLDEIADLKHRNSSTMDAQIKISGTYQTDDFFAPYLRFEVKR